MRCLRFERVGVAAGGRIVRAARFGERSSLPISAACVVANGMRETLASLLQVAIAVRALEPVIPTRAAWSDVLRDAAVTRVRGSLAEAAIVVRPGAARALVAAAFGETLEPGRPLSGIERDVLSRIVRAIAATLGPICGPSIDVREAVPPPRSFSTYFEVLVERPHRASIGIALAAEPEADVRGALRATDLLDVPLELRVTLARTRLCAAEVARLQVGAFVPMTSGVEAPGALCLGERTLARGTCGARRGHYAFLVEDETAQRRTA